MTEHEITLANSTLADNYRRRGLEVPDDLDSRRMIRISPLNDRETELIRQLEDANHEITDLQRENYSLRMRVTDLERRLLPARPLETPKVQKEVMQPAQTKDPFPVGASKPGTIDL